MILILSKYLTSLQPDLENLSTLAYSPTFSLKEHGKKSHHSGSLLSYIPSQTPISRGQEWQYG